MAGLKRARRAACPTCESAPARRTTRAGKQWRKRLQRKAASFDFGACLRCDDPSAPAEREADRAARAALNGERVEPARESARGGAPDGALRTALESAAGGGAPLSQPIRELLEPRLGADLGEIRVHADDRAHRLASQLGATAFTYGSDIYFRQGAYDPASHEGRETLAHEVVHSLQQRDAAPAVQRQQAPGPSEASRARAIEGAALASLPPDQVAELWSAREALLTAPASPAPREPLRPSSWAFREVHAIARRLWEPIAAQDEAVALIDRLLAVRQWLLAVRDRKAWEAVGLPRWRDPTANEAIRRIDETARDVEAAALDGEPTRVSPAALYSILRALLRGRGASEWEVFRVDREEAGGWLRRGHALIVEGVETLERWASSIDTTERAAFRELAQHRRRLFSDLRRRAAFSPLLVDLVDALATVTEALSMAIAMMAGFAMGFVRIALLILPGLYRLLELVYDTVAVFVLAAEFGISEATGRRMSREHMDLLEHHGQRLIEAVRGVGAAVERWRSEWESAPTEERAYMLGDLIAQLVVILATARGSAGRGPRPAAAPEPAPSAPAPRAWVTPEGVRVPVPAAEPAVAPAVPSPPLPPWVLARTPTEPSGRPDPQATARGRSDLERRGGPRPEHELSPEVLRTQRALAAERRAADAMAQAGFDVEFTEGRFRPGELEAEGLDPNARPDLRIEGRLADVYTPGRGTSVDRVVRHIFDKVHQQQARRVVVHLDRDITRLDQNTIAERLRNEVKRHGARGLKEVFVVQRGRVYRIYPRPPISYPVR